MQSSGLQLPHDLLKLQVKTTLHFNYQVLTRCMLLNYCCLTTLPVLSLKAIAEDLQSSISRHSQLVAPTAPIDLRAVLKYAHKIAYTSFAPVGHDPTQPLPQHFRPPNPQEWQLRASQLHQFQGQTVHNRIDLLHACHCFIGCIVLGKQMEYVHIKQT